MEPSFVILTESSCDLTPELAQRSGVEILPLTFTMEEKTYAHYPDGREMPIAEFYRKIRSGATATTAAANVAELSNTMEQHLRRGKDVLFLCFSSGLSSTRDACVIAAEELRERYPERRIETVDTLSAAAGQGLLVLLAGQERLQGKTLEQVRDYVEETRLHIAHWFMVEDLAYLKRGGRISPTAAAIGTMLHIKPLLRVDDEGKLAAMEKARGKKAAVQTLLRHMEETALRPVGTVLITHADSPDGAAELEQEVRERFSPREILTVPMGPVIGAHTGPGLLALVFLAQRR